MQKWIKRVPLDRLLLETDAPALVRCFGFGFLFGSMVRHAIRLKNLFEAQAAEKGSVNYPQHLPIGCEVIAEIKGLPVQEVARETRRNALRLFFRRELEGEEGGDGV